MNEMRAAALLMREVICEKVFRAMQGMDVDFDLVEKFDFAHPNRALGIREITPEKILPYVTLEVLSMTKDQLKAHAATILNLMESDKPVDQHPPNGLLCSICKLPQISTPGGSTCTNGHGGAEGVAP